MKKFLLTGVLFGCSVSALAATDWQEVLHESDSVTTYFDANSFKTQKDKNTGKHYIEARFQRVFKQPQLDKNSQKYYTNFYHTLAVDCQNHLEKSTDYKWAINGKTVKSSLRNDASWKKINDYGIDVSEAVGLCEHHQSFLGS